MLAPQHPPILIYTYIHKYIVKSEDTFSSAEVDFGGKRNSKIAAYSVLIHIANMYE